MLREALPVCRNWHCDAPTELDKAGQCDTCGCYHREFDTMLYTPWRDERARKSGEERREQIELLRGGLRRLVEGMGKRWPTDPRVHNNRPAVLRFFLHRQRHACRHGA